MTYYARFDHTATGATQITGYYDTDFHPYPDIDFTAPGFLELSKEVWDQRRSDSFLLDGKLIPRPQPTGEELEKINLRILQHNAQQALKESDNLVLQYYEEGEPVPDDLKAYRKSLRSIMSGSTELKALPELPKTNK